MKRVKKMMAFFLAIIMVVPFFVGTLPIHAEENKETVMVAVDTVKAKAGETVDVAIRVKNNPGIASIKLNVAYGDTLTLKGVTYNESIGGMSMKPQTLTSPVILNWFNGLSNSDGDWIFATLTFEVSEDAVGGTETEISFTYDPNDIYNIEEKNITVNPVYGKVIVECMHEEKTEVPAKNPDCVNAGNNLYYICETCDKVFKVDGVTETSIDAEIIPALGHDMSNANCISPASCKNGCGHTEGSALGHDWNEKLMDATHLKDIATNCSEYNTFWYDCSRCDEMSAEDYYTSSICGNHVLTEKIEDNAHHVAGSGENCQSAKQYYYDCEYCDFIGREMWSSTVYGEHQISSEWTTKDGKHYHACTVKGCLYVEDEAVCSGGTATCTEKAICSDCNIAYGNLAAHDFETEWNQGDATGHWHVCKNCDVHDDAVAHSPNVDEATEETAKYCTECGYIMEEQHIHETTKVDGYDATCTEDGQKTYYICSCGKWFEDKQATVEITDKASVVIKALGHEWSKEILDDAHIKTMALNCTEYNSYWYTCANCEAISTTEYFESTVMGTHIFTEEIEDDAHYVVGSGENCQSEKQYYYDCEYCDTIGTDTWDTGIYGEHIVKLVDGFEASCTKAGQKTHYSCSCGAMFEDEEALVRITDKESIVIEVLGHVDADNDGKCDRCDYVMFSKEEVGVPNTGDDFNHSFWMLLMLLGSGVIVLGAIFNRKNRLFSK